MWALKLRPSNPCHTPIRRHNYQRCELALQRPIQERETFDIQHVHLVDEQHPGNDLRLAFFAPFCDFGVDLCAQLGFYLACVPCKEGEEALGT